MRSSGAHLRDRPFSSKLLFLDGLRGLAAAYVMIGHARWLLWEGYSSGYLHHPARYTPAGKLLVNAAAVFRWGHEAVLFFFVLSGLVIHLRYARGLVEDPRTTIAFGPYLWRRARRLYPPLILAMLLTFVLDGLGRRWQLPTAGTSTLYPMINQNVGHQHDARTALRNLAFIMDPVFGSDGPLWSLNDEWYFYLLYPLFLLIGRRSWRLGTLALIGLSALGFGLHWPRSLWWVSGVFQLMIVWWFGALLADRIAGRFKVSYSRLSLLTLAFAIVPLWRWNFVACDIVVGVGFCGVIAGCLALQERGHTLSALVRLRPVGSMSYTLYVTHFPILVFMSGCLMKASGGFLPQHFGWVAAGSLLCLALGWLFHLVVERPFVSR